MDSRIDELDIQLLDLLQSDARMPFVKLADALGVSDTTVRTRVDRLVRLLGVKFVVDFDPAALGLLYLYLAARVQGATMAKAIERLAQMPEIVSVGRTTGGYDLICEIICRDNDDLTRVLDAVRAIPGIVHMDTFNVLRVEKEDWRFSGFAAGRGTRRRSK
ncbi:MAG: Lrp/AsnC family transcriptional regulator [Actinomycetia bacterium]|nr:Lrp/AsnC family transcriptional regulator [Actinomycetes bacterium]